MITRGTTPNLTTKVFLILEIIRTTKSSFKTRKIYSGIAVFIEKTKSMVKAIRSKSDVNVCTIKLDTNTDGNCMMDTFHRTKLLTAIRTSRTDSKAVTLQELSYFCRTIPFSTLIESHKSSVVSSRAVQSKPITKIVQRNSLRLESFIPN